MKKAILVLTFALISAATFAQSNQPEQSKKVLPAVVTINTKEVDLAALFNKIDSLQNFSRRTDIPSLAVTEFNARVLRVVAPLYNEISKQLVEAKPAADSTKAVKPKVKSK